MPLMPDPQQPDRGRAPLLDVEVVEPVQAPAPGVELEETLDGVPVLSEVRAIESAAPSLLPAVQVAAVAATGFIAGAATLAVVKRRSARRLARARQQRRAVDMLPIVGSRSFLVDVHLIAKPE